MGEGELPNGFDTRSVRSGGPSAYDDLLGTPHLTHHFPEKQGTVVIGKDMDDLTVLEMRNQLSEKRLMCHGWRCNHNQAGALYHLAHVTAYHIQVGSAGALKAVEVTLDAVQQDACLLQVGKRVLGKRHHVIKTDLFWTGISFSLFLYVN